MLLQWLIKNNSLQELNLYNDQGEYSEYDSEIVSLLKNLANKPQPTLMKLTLPCFEIDNDYLEILNLSLSPIKEKFIQLETAFAKEQTILVKAIDFIKSQQPALAYQAMTQLTLLPLLDEGCRALINNYLEQHHESHTREQIDEHLCRALALIPNLFDLNLHFHKQIFMKLLHSEVKIFAEWDGVFAYDYKKSLELIKKINAYAEDNKQQKKDIPTAYTQRSERTLFSRKRTQHVIDLDYDNLTSKRHKNTF